MIHLQVAFILSVLSSLLPAICAALSIPCKHASESFLLTGCHLFAITRLLSYIHVPIIESLLSLLHFTIRPVIFDNTVHLYGRSNHTVKVLNSRVLF
jgi:hypothetical protein